MIKKHSIAIFSILVVIVILISVNVIENNEYKKLSNYEKLKNSIESFYENNSYKISFRKIIETNTEDNISIKRKVETNLQVSDLNKKIDLKVGNNNIDTYLGGLFINTERIEVITPKQESVFICYKDIFNVLNRSLPTLSIIISDYEKINYIKYFNLIKKEIIDLVDKINFEKYEEVIKTNLEKNITYVGKEEIELDEKVILTDKYEIDMTNKEKIELIKDILILLKEDENIINALIEFANNIFNEIEKDKEYEKVRFTETEYMNFKKWILDNINDYQKKFDIMITNLNNLNNPNNINEKIKIIYYLHESNIVCITNDTEYIGEYGKIKESNEILISQINKINNSQIQPKVVTRINLGQKDRAEIFSACMIIKNQFESVIKEAYNILLNDIIKT